MSVRTNSNRLIMDGSQDIPVPMHLNFGKFIFDKIRQMGDEVAVHNVLTGEKYTYKKLTQQTVDLSISFTKLGMGKGDIVLLYTDTIEYVPTALAVIFTGATLSPIYLNYGRALLQNKLTIDSPTFLICTDQYWEQFSDILKDNKTIKTVITYGYLPNSAVAMTSLVHEHYDVETFSPADVLGQDDVAVIYPSSGTSGMPKQVQLTHLNCILHCQSDDYESLSTGLYCRIWGINYYDFKTFMFLANGKKMVYANIFTIENALRSIEKYKVDIIFTTPHHLYELVNSNGLEDYDLSTLKIIHSRSSSLHKKIIEKIKKKFPPNVEVVQSYGMTECSELASGMRVLHGGKGLKLGSVGVPSRGIVLKVAPSLLETVLQLHQAVKEAGVVAIPDLKIGDSPVAFVVKQQDSIVTEQELVEYVETEVGIKLHGSVKFCTELPRNNRGKIIRNQLKEMFNQIAVKES